MLRLTIQTELTTDPTDKHGWLFIICVNPCHPWLKIAWAASGTPHHFPHRLADEVVAISYACVAANMSIAPPFLRVACREVPMPADKKHRLNQV